ncbi:hypothetical protein WISP_93421 [Willisornis vidua]|uniref:Uncharacterized protein n=1 Tax=Willisornis vidua TaxID=1566151 RepID=A0ABQ9D6M9_9PASS|nr:hypothetical protein WISP_93421 [Willisornis vidua]
MFIVHMAEDNPNNTHSMRRVQLACWENKTSEDEKAEEAEKQEYSSSSRTKAILADFPAQLNSGQTGKPLRKLGDAQHDPEASGAFSTSNRNGKQGEPEKYYAVLFSLKEAAGLQGQSILGIRCKLVEHQCWDVLVEDSSSNASGVKPTSPTSTWAVRTVHSAASCIDGEVTWGLCSLGSPDHSKTAGD